MKNQRQNSDEYQRHLRESGGDYGVKRSRWMDNVAKVVTFVIAFLIWLYVVSTNTETLNQTYDLIPIEVTGTESILENGLAVQNLDYDCVNVTLKGTRSALSNVTTKDIAAYVDLSGISEPGKYSLTVKYNLPSGVAVVSNGETIQVTVDSLSSRVIPMDQSKIDLNSWSISSDCRIDLERSELNIDFVVVEAPTMVLSRVADVRVRANNTVTLSTDSNVSAVVEALDAAGNVISDSALSIEAYQGGTVTENGALSGAYYTGNVSVSIALLKEKTVPLTVSDSDGYVSSERIAITPSTVTVTGSPSAVDALHSLDLGTFSSKNLLQDENGKATFSLSLQELPLGINEVRAEEVASVGTSLLTAEVSVQVGTLYEMVVPVRYVTVVGGSASPVGDSVTLSLRVVEDETYFLLLQQRIRDGEDGISLVVNLSGIQVQTQTVAPLTVIFSAEFEGKLYEVFEADAPYSIKVKPLEN